MDIKERFEKKYEPVTETGCWIWNASVDKDGYGYFHTKTVTRGAKMQRAHRVSYQMYKGSIPKGKVVCHTCDTPSCVNPHHLFVGTHKENMQDMVNKKRHGNQHKGKNNAA